MGRRQPEGHGDTCPHLLFTDRRAKPTPYRDEQNVIREASGEIVCTPPEATDVPILMREMVNWIERSEPEFSVPAIAGIAHYQFVTIHPFLEYLLKGIAG